MRATPIAEAMMALVLMDHALLHRAQNADVTTKTPHIATSLKRAVSSGKKKPTVKNNHDPAEA
jgi:chorismate synthase